MTAKKTRERELLDRPLGHIETPRPGFTFGEFLVVFGKTLFFVAALLVLILVFVHMIVR